MAVFRSMKEQAHELYAQMQAEEQRSARLARELGAARDAHDAMERALFERKSSIKEHHRKGSVLLAELTESGQDMTAKEKARASGVEATLVALTTQLAELDPFESELHRRDDAVFEDASALVKTTEAENAGYATQLAAVEQLESKASDAARALSEALEACVALEDAVAASRAASNEVEKAVVERNEAAAVAQRGTAARDNAKREALENERELTLAKEELKTKKTALAAQPSAASLLASRVTDEQKLATLTEVLGVLRGGAAATKKSDAERAEHAAAAAATLHERERAVTDADAAIKAGVELLDAANALHAAAEAAAAANALRRKASAAREAREAQAAQTDELTRVCATKKEALDAAKARFAVAKQEDAASSAAAPAASALDGTHERVAAAEADRLTAERALEAEKAALTAQHAVATGRADKVKAEALAAAKARESEYELALAHFSREVDALESMDKENAELERKIAAHSAENARLADAIARAETTARAS